jgi:hypothetical protein
MRKLLGAAVLLCGALATSGAQDPSRDYLTIATPHFRVSFTPALETIARRTAANAERAYAQLTSELHPPRGTIDILVTDDFDFSNGSAITYPTNRIIVYAMPPVNDFGLRYTTDWAQMVVTHELTHIFHLDRVRGVWRLGQYVFGRSPFLFPNVYQPSWLIEGLAVYEESRLAGQGRIEGAENTMLARAAAVDRNFPSIGDASLARPSFPQGNSAYAFGSLFMAYLARTRGDSSIRKYVEASSASLIPYLIDIPARSAFGTRFSSAWSEWRDTVSRMAFDNPSPLPNWRRLGPDYLVAQYPRWSADGDTISFTASTGRDVLSQYAATPDGAVNRVAARNGLSPTVRLPSGDVVFAQNEYIGPYRYRSDLFVQRGREAPRRLTMGMRLFTPDARADGSLIAMQVTEGATRLVRVSQDGATITPITRSHPDTLWSEGRWSHRGDRIVASRWIRGGISQVVVIDTLGSPVKVAASAMAELAAPSWTKDDQAVLFTAGFNPVNTWRADLETGRFARVSNAAAGLIESEMRDSAAVAAFEVRSTGYRLGVGGFAPEPDDATAMLDLVQPDRRLPALAVDSSPARKYSALRQLRPRYWVPLAESGYDGAYMLGGYTESWDILRRHYLYAEARVPTDNSGLTWTLEHQYRGLGRPIFSTTASQDWTPFPINGTTGRVGTLHRRINDAEVLSTFVRQRVRSSLSFSVGGGWERRDYLFDPGALRATLDTGGRFQVANFPRVTAALGYARYFTPPFAISPEDGFSAAVTARERFHSGFNSAGGASASVVGSAAVFKALDLPGYAHHVLAIHGSGGWADTRTSGYFDVGGVSGGSFQVFPGYTIGEGRRTFPVRGFEPGSASGIRAATASVEYRAPLSMRQRSLSTLPTFLQRSTVTLFSDYGVAWCPSTAPTREVCVDPAEEARRDLASVGGELSINAGLLSWDAPTRLRFGVALPIRNGNKRPVGYFTTGISF